MGSVGRPASAVGRGSSMAELNECRARRAAFNGACAPNNDKPSTAHINRNAAIPLRLMWIRSSWAIETNG